MATEQSSLKELAKLFLKLGCLGFGDPAVRVTKTAIIDWKSITIGILVFVITLRYKTLNSAFVVLGGAVLGYLLWLI